MQASPGLHAGLIMGLRLQENLLKGNVFNRFHQQAAPLLKGRLLDRPLTKTLDAHQEEWKVFVVFIYKQLQCS